MINLFTPQANMIDHAESLSVLSLLKLIDVHFSSEFTDDTCLYCLQFTFWICNLLFICHYDPFHS